MYPASASSPCGAAVIDIIADVAAASRSSDIESRHQQSVNAGGCALNIAVALKRLGIDASNALPLGRGVGGGFAAAQK